VLSHNDGVSHGRKLIWLLLVISAGCSTGTYKSPPDVNLSPDRTATNSVPKPALTLTPAPAATRPAITNTPAPQTNHFNLPDSLVSWEDWTEANGFGRPHRVPVGSSLDYSLFLTNGSLDITIGSPIAHWRGVQVHLGFIPEMIGGHPFVHSLDIRKNFLPLLKNPIHYKANPVIVIDPGHGGVDTGTSDLTDHRTEKEYSLDWAKRLRPLLEEAGWTVWLTRTNDVNMPLSSRVAFAEQHKADLFISLHFNSAFPDRQEAGLETYCLTPRGMPSTLTRGFRDVTSLSFPNNNFDEENLRYAAELQRSLLKVNGHMDRGVRRARFLGVLQGQNRPAVLIEGGFLSNPREARHIADPEYRQRMAEAVARALEECSADSRETVAKPVMTSTNHSAAKKIETHALGKTSLPESLHE
jgi:N-acetylmuramoyl-L-alanine amidase